ncbi:MAG: hypothetical protein GX567_08485, partial [Clostridia bacterium]|nr:hypothetical protein [Clostridia bacterium]
MEEKIQDGALCSLKKSKFVRTVFLRIILIILIVIIAVIAIVFFFFTSEIRNSILSERQKQLDVINDTISERMEAATSIAYNIGTDESFYLESVEKEKYSGTVMSKTLERYLVGNDFIEHLAYYRISDPDVLYTSKGEISFIDFLCSFMRFDQTTAQTCIDEIQSTNKVVVKSFLSEKAERHYFTYLCPLPQFSKNPQAFVIMLIPEHVLSDVLETQLMHYTGEVLIYNALGEELYKISNLTKDIPLSLSELNASETLVIDGSRYMIQKSVSDSNGWTYVSIIRMSDIISGVAQKQIIFIVLLLILM